MVAYQQYQGRCDFPVPCKSGPLRRQMKCAHSGRAAAARAGPAVHVPLFHGDGTYKERPDTHTSRVSESPRVRRSRVVACGCVRGAVGGVVKKRFSQRAASLAARRKRSERVSCRRRRQIRLSGSGSGKEKGTRRSALSPPGAVLRAASEETSPLSATVEL